jgi:hypothetical protein
MKTILFKIAIVATFAALFVSCDDKKVLTNLNVTGVKKLYEPTQGKVVKLATSASANLYFEWEPAKAEDSGMVLYEVAFDKEGGDFSSPIYKIASDNNGSLNHASISHKIINKVAALAGIKPSETGKISWTVFASKGINEVKGEQFGLIQVTRLSGFEDLPIDLYLTGEGSEGGATLANALKFKSTAPGEFEIYTKLTAGKDYQFVEGISGTPKNYYVNGDVLKLGGKSQIATTGIYRIKLDFNIGAVSFTEIKKIELYFSPNDTYMFELTYDSKGKWKAVNKSIVFKQQSWGRDERYKFSMTTADALGQESEEWWGSTNADNSRPTTATPASYFKMVPVDDSQWDYTFKFQTEADNANVNVLVFFTGDEEYRHQIVIL